MTAPDSPRYLTDKQIHAVLQERVGEKSNAEFWRIIADAATDHAHDAGYYEGWALGYKNGMNHGVGIGVTRGRAEAQEAAAGLVDWSGSTAHWLEQLGASGILANTESEEVLSSLIVSYGHFKAAWVKFLEGN